MSIIRNYLPLFVVLLTKLSAQAVFTESFTGTTAPGWQFGGNYTPNLTANSIDAPGDGWLRLTDSANNRSTYAFLDTEIFSVNARIEITMEYAFYNGSGADGITFFLVDGSTTAASFDPGSYGGSMGYAQRTGEGGMEGGYLGFALDNFGNYSNGNEGRNGGLSNDGTLYPNRVAVRGPESSNYEFIAASAPLPQQMDFPGSTSRPNQTGADYRAFQILFDANNQLEVFMKFGATSDFVSVFTADLAAYDRPDTFKLGFTGATGGSTEIHEIRNLMVETTPWSSGSGAYEWDNGAGTTTWGSSAGTEGNDNWFSEISGDNNKTPTPGSDILFGTKPASGPQVVNAANNIEVRNLTFDTGYDYTLQGAGVITLGNTTQAGLPSINVNNYNNAIARHKINNDLTVAEALRINNYSFSTLCLNGTLETNGNEIRVNGYGAVNFNGDISGSGDLVKNGRGITTISNDNSNDPDGGDPRTAWSGDVTVNEGLLVVTADGALGNTTGTTTVNSGGTLAFRDTTGSGLNYSTAESVTISGRGVERGAGQSAGAIYNDGGDNTFAGGVTLAANAAVGSRDGVLTLSGVVGDGASTYALTKVGEGVVSLTGTNTYGGDTVIEEGVLRVTTGSLPGGYDTSNTGNDYGAVNLAGGVLELASGTNFTRSVGTGEEQIFWSGDGGFSASGGDRTVTLDGGTMTWGSGSFVPTGNALLLSSNYSDATVTFTNALALGSEVREVRVANGSAAVDGALSGNISGAGGILKTGEGTLNLAGGTKNYSGATVIREGAVRGSTGSNSNIQLEGGVRELAGGYSDNLGTTGGLIQWTGDGGLAADTTNRTFNVGGNNQTLTWGGTTGNSQYFVDDGDVLILGSRSTAALLTFDNAINLDGAERTIQVIDSASVAEEAILNRDVSGGDLRVIGDGSLGITVNTSLAGAVTVEGATLRVRNNGRLDNVSGVTIKNGGALLLDSSASATDRLANSAPVTMNGGTLGFYGRTSDNNSTETIGAVTLQGGGNTIDVVNNRSGRSTELTSASLTRNDGATVDFTNSTTTNGTYGTGNTPRLTFTAAPTLTNGILAYATVNGSAFATLSGNRIVAAASADGSPWVGTFNVTLDSASGALGGATDREVNSVRLSGSGTSTVAFEGRNLDIVSGGVLSTGTGANSFTGAGTLTSSSGELIVHTYGTAGMNIGVTITNSGVNPVALTKTGNSTLTLSGSSANTYTGLTRVNDGTLILSKDAGIAAIGGDLQIGDGRGVDTVRFINNEQLSINTDVTLSGGLTGAAASTNNIAVLDLNGTTQSFDGLTIIGNSVIDFSGGDPCAPTFLNINSLTFVGDATLTIKNWIEFTDFFLIADNASVDFARITFEGYGGQAGWQDYSTGWKQITPVPEPSSYGAIFLGGAAALMLLRRRPRGTQQR